MFLTRTKPTILPFQIADLKQHCRVDADYTDDDVILKKYAWAAIRSGEFSSNRVWVDSEWTGEMDTFPRGGFEVPKSPCTDVAGITFVDSHGVGQVLAPTAYKFRRSSLEVGSGSVFARVDPVGAWPSGSDVVVSFKAGWPDGELPENLIGWIFVKVSSHYEQREDLASATRKIAIAFPRHFVDASLDEYYIPRF